MRNGTSVSLCLLSLVTVLALGGCGREVSYEKEYFVLEAERSGEPGGQPVRTGTLEVRRFSVDAAFATKSLIYRTGKYAYEADHYRRFLIAPGVMIKEKTRDWLARAGLFQRVLPLSSRAGAEYTLEATVTALYGDFRGSTDSAAVVEIRFFLLASTHDTDRVIFTETYRTRSPVPTRTPTAFVAALNDSLVEILRRLEADLREQAGSTEGVVSGTGT